MALLWAAAAVITGISVLAITNGGGGSGTTERIATQRTRSAPRPQPPKHEARERGRRSRPNSTRAAVHHAVAQSKAPSLDPAQREVTGFVRDYVTALDERDGGRVCSLFAPDALSGVKFPRDRGDCASTVSASIGYRNPRGTPVYRRSRVARIPDVAIEGSTARVTATIVTRFADNREPSVEDDVIYLVQRGERWLIEKPSATLYRAIGVGNIPPRVLAPP
jgi:hypothetical protein